MYLVSRSVHEKYGKIISISLDHSGEFISPYQAVQKLRNIKRLWKLEEPENKIRYLVDNKIMTIAQVESWSNEEYKSLSKCENCGTILKENVFTHALCKSNLFCSQLCTDQNHKICLDKLEDEEECECF